MNVFSKRLFAKSILLFSFYSNASDTQSITNTNCAFKPIISAITGFIMGVPAGLYNKPSTTKAFFATSLATTALFNNMQLHETSDISHPAAAAFNSAGFGLGFSVGYSVMSKINIQSLHDEIKDLQDKLLDLDVNIPDSDDEEAYSYTDN